MRLQLAVAIALGLCCFARAARADGSLTERDVYYKERSTRVIQPMLDGIFDVGTRGTLTAHFLVDAITSASAGEGAANGVPFNERRYEAGAGYLHELDGPQGSIVDKIRVGGDGKYSTESDYTSYYGDLRLESDLAQKNATVGLGGGFSHDSINNSDAQGPMGGPPLVCDSDKPTVTAAGCHLSTYSLFVSGSQIVSRNAVVAVTYDLSHLNGFQANPYRTVITDNGLLPESHPNTRTRQAVAASARLYWPLTRTTFIPAYRYYRDDWHIQSHTPELRIVQQVGEHADATLRFRYYWQTASYFYADRYGEIDTSAVHYITDDPKMSKFDGETVEAKLGVYGEAFGLEGGWAGARFEGILSYIVQNNRFGNAAEAQIALTYPFNY